MELARLNCRGSIPGPDYSDPSSLSSLEGPGNQTNSEFSCIQTCVTPSHGTSAANGGRSIEGEQVGWVSCEECTGRHREEGRLPQQSYLQSLEMLVE